MAAHRGCAGAMRLLAQLPGSLSTYGSRSAAAEFGHAASARTVAGRQVTRQAGAALKLLASEGGAPTRLQVASPCVRFATLRGDCYNPMAPGMLSGLAALGRHMVSQPPAPQLSATSAAPCSSASAASAHTTAASTAQAATSTTLTSEGDSEGVSEPCKESSSTLWVAGHNFIPLLSYSVPDLRNAVRWPPPPHATLATSQTGAAARGLSTGTAAALAAQAAPAHAVATPAIDFGDVGARGTAAARAPTTFVLAAAGGGAAARAGGQAAQLGGAGAGAGSGSRAPAESSAGGGAVGDSEAFRRQHDVRVQAAGPSAVVPDPVLSFEAAGFPRPVLATLLKSGFTEPTPIQSQAWPVALSGTDLVAIANTGSGKTAGYLLPALVRIFTGQIKHLSKPEGGADGLQPRSVMGRARGVMRSSYAGPLALVLAPTRELAQQIEQQAVLFGRPLGIESVVVYGGADKSQQLHRLRSAHPLVLVATPGRLLDLVCTGLLPLNNVQYLVLDEADRMLDMGFGEQIHEVVGMLPQSPARQTCFFSATWPKEVRTLAREIAGRDPVTILIGRVSEQPVAARSIKQDVVIVGTQAEKFTHMRTYIKQLMEEASGGRKAGKEEGKEGGQGQQDGSGEKHPLRIIVFAATKSKADELKMWFEDSPDLPRADAVHGGCSQGARDLALRRFRQGRVQVLVATDVAARGLDIPHVTGVINFDVPQPGRSEDYVHRIGRTGRAGATGKSLALINRTSASDQAFATALVKILREAGQPVSPEVESLAHHAPHMDHLNRGGGRSRAGGGSRGRWGQPQRQWGSSRSSGDGGGRWGGWDSGDGSRRRPRRDGDNGGEDEERPRKWERGGRAPHADHWVH